MNFLKRKSPVFIIDSCPICFEYKKLCNAYHSDGSVHRFCTDCISNWIYKSGESGCPLCRQHIQRVDSHHSGTVLYKFCVFLVKSGISLHRIKYNNDKNIALIAVSKNGLALKYVSDSLKNDFHVVFTAVSQNGLALQFSSDSMKNNATIVHTAVKQCGLALRYAPQFNTNIHIALDAVKSHRYGFIYINKNFFIPDINPIIQTGIQFAIDNKRPDFIN